MTVYEDALLFRGIIVVSIVASANFMIYLGYRLYVRGVESGESRIQFRSKLATFIASGAGPGMLFMALGAMILMAEIIWGGASVTYDPTKDKEVVQAKAAVELQRWPEAAQVAAAKSGYGGTTNKEPVGPHVHLEAKSSGPGGHGK